MQGGPEASEEGATRERKAFPLRLSADLHEELRRWATQDLRSLNAHIEFLLREAVRRRRGSAPAGESPAEGG